MSNLEMDRGGRICSLTSMLHDSADKIYETAVDREYDKSVQAIKTMQKDLKMMLKLIEDDDF
jgi:hypothetical protein